MGGAAAVEADTKKGRKARGVRQAGVLIIGNEYGGNFTATPSSVIIITSGFRFFLAQVTE